MKERCNYDLGPDFRCARALARAEVRPGSLADHADSDQPESRRRGGTHQLDRGTGLDRRRERKNKDTKPSQPSKKRAAKPSKSTLINWHWFSLSMRIIAFDCLLPCAMLLTWTSHANGHGSKCSHPSTRTRSAAYDQHKRLWPASLASLILSLFSLPQKSLTRPSGKLETLGLRCGLQPLPFCLAHPENHGGLLALVWIYRWSS